MIICICTGEGGIETLIVCSSQVLSCLALSCLVRSCLVLSGRVLCCFVFSFVVLCCLVWSLLVCVLCCAVLSSFWSSLCLYLACLVLSCPALSCLGLELSRLALFSSCHALCAHVSPVCPCPSICMSAWPSILKLEKSTAKGG